MAQTRRDELYAGGILSASPHEQLADRTHHLSYNHQTFFSMTKAQFMQDLERDGYVVVPNVIPQKSCDEFVESGWKWLEAFPNGFKRDDKSTWTAEHLPFGHDRFVICYKVAGDQLLKIVAGACTTATLSTTKTSCGELGREVQVSTILSTHSRADEKSSSEPGILKVFEQLWGTKDLIASFDGMNVSLPVNEKTGRTDIETTSKQANADQSTIL